MNEVQNHPLYSTDRENLDRLSSIDSPESIHFITKSLVVIDGKETIEHMHLSQAIIDGHIYSFYMITPPLPQPKHHWFNLVDQAILNSSQS